MKRRILAGLAAGLLLSALTGAVPAAAIEPAFCFPKPMPSVTITNVDYVYETESAKLNVALSNGYCWTVKVDYMTVAGTASSPGDYVYKSGTLEFSPTEKCCSKSITININEDAPEPATEWFIVVLSNPLNATIGTSAGGTYSSSTDLGPPDEHAGGFGGPLPAARTADGSPMGHGA